MEVGFNPYAIGPILCFGVACFVGALIWSKQSRLQARRATFAPLCVVAGLWSLGVAVVMSSTHDVFALAISKFVISLVILSGAAAMSFATDFARVPHRGALVVASLALAGAGVAHVWVDPRVVPRLQEPFWGGRYPLADARLLVSIAPTLINVVLATGISFHTWLKTPPSRRRRQAGYITLSYLVGLLGAIDLLAVFGWDAIPPLGWATSLLSMLIVFYAIVRWRLMDIRTALHRTLFWGVAMAVTAGPLYALTRGTEGWSGWSRFWPRTIAIVAILAILRVYVAAAEGVIARVLERRRARHARVLEDFARSALAARTPADLVPPLHAALRAIADLRLVCVDLGGRTYWRKPTSAREVAPYPALPAEPLARADLDLDSPGDVSVEASLVERRGDLVIPIGHGAITARGPASSLDETTRQTLTRLGARAEVAFTNASLYDDLERRSASLEAEVEERTQALARAIDDLKSAQANLVQAEKQSALGLLVAGVSHEINNALNFIYGNLPTLEKYVKTYEELLARAAPPAEVAEAARAAGAALDAEIASVDEAARRARRIVDDLRRFARHDEAERKPADVREGLDSTVNLLATELRGRVVIQRDYDPDLPRIECFPAALNHVFLNVLLNAAQAIKGEGTVTIRARRAERGIEIKVEDSAGGIPDKDRERVFEPFYTTKRRAAGLGLTVSRQIVQRHGGTITAGPDGVTIRLPEAAV